VNGEDEEFAHWADGSTITDACKTAREGRIPSYCDFATHRRLDAACRFARSQRESIAETIAALRAMSDALSCLLAWRAKLQDTGAHEECPLVQAFTTAIAKHRQEATNGSPVLREHVKVADAHGHSRIACLYDPRWSRQFRSVSIRLKSGPNFRHGPATPVLV